jgi:hypothetical protein
MALDYVAAFMEPLLKTVNTVDYARKSRELKVSEEYAARLMRGTYGFAKGKLIARRLVESYPEHGFVIDVDEAVTEDSTGDPESFGLGLIAEKADKTAQDLFDRLQPFLDTLTAIGRIQEV